MNVYQDLSVEGSDNNQDLNMQINEYERVDNRLEEEEFKKTDHTDAESIISNSMYVNTAVK